MSPRTRLVGVLAMVVLGACTSPTTTTTTSPDPTGTSTAAGPGGCGEVEYPTVQLSSHLVGDAEPPGPFSSVPPTSGWHTTTVPAAGLATEPVRDAAIVSALENGIVVLAIAPDTFDAVAPDVLDELVAQFPDRLLVTAYPTPMATPVALLTWGRLQRCDAVDPSAVTTFVLTERVAPEDH